MWPEFLGKKCGIIREGLVYLEEFPNVTMTILLLSSTIPKYLLIPLNDLYLVSP